MRSWMLLLLMYSCRCATARPWTDWNVTEASCHLPSFHFDDGSKMDLRLHYRRLGTDRGGGAVLLLHGTGGTGAEFLSDHFAGESASPQRRRRESEGRRGYDAA